MARAVTPPGWSEDGGAVQFSRSFVSDPVPRWPRLARAARWLAPSAACACSGALAAGGFEAVGVGGPLAMLATIGFFAMLAGPVLFGASVAARAVIAGWGPRGLAERLTEDGGMPALAAWVLTIFLAAFGLAWLAFQGTWQLAAWTAFKPLTLSFLQPVITVGGALALLALSVPAARLFTRPLRWLNRKVALTPVRVFGAAAVISVGTVYALWRLMVKPRIGPVDTSVLYAPLIAIAVTGLAHVAAARIRKRRAIGMVLGATAAALVATAVVTVKTRPSLTLEIWGDRPLAGIAIERVFDLDRIRAAISLSEFRPVDRPGAEHPDIVLITIDTVRADHTPPYGGAAEMPVLAGLGERGAVFTWAFSPSNVTRRSIPSIVIGAAPTRIKGRVVGWALRVDPRHVLLAERLLAAGYETAGFMCCKGFYDPEIRTGLQRGLEHLVIEPNGRSLGQTARNWISAREQRPGPRRPLFVWMHILEPHNWEIVGGPWHEEAERQKLYNRSLEISDAIMLDTITGFADRPPEKTPIVIVTADHGEALGEHNQPNHSTDLYNSQIRVPLVIAGPGIKPARIMESVSLTDLVPTIVELAGFEPPRDGSIDGRSLADLLRGKRVEQPDSGTAFSAMIKDRSNPGGVTSVVSGRWKLIDTNGVFELYDLHSDPGEQSNLIGTRPEMAAQMRKLLEQTLLRHAKSPFE